MICQLCGCEDGEAHAGKIHKFTPEGVDTSQSLPSKKEMEAKKSSAAAPTAVGRGLGGDPALRLALISAGVITHVQLLAAEQEILDARATGRPAVAEGDPAGKSAADQPAEPRRGA